MAGDTCFCGSGRPLEICHGRLPRRGPGAATLLTADQFDWALQPAPRSPRRPAPPGIQAPEYARSGIPDRGPLNEIRTALEIAALRRTCAEAADLLIHLSKLVSPGITTEEIDDEAYSQCLLRRAYPSTLNFHGYSKSICTSVNEVVCHGMPDRRPLREGDIVNLDVTIFREGVHGDTSATYLVGEVNGVAKRLVEVTQQALRAGIGAVRPGRPLSDIARTIDAVADRNGYSVVRDYVGHGIGPRFHTGLQVQHHLGPGIWPVIRAGMVFTIEPMLNAGGPETAQWADGWTAVTADLSRSAQFEHTVLVTPTGVEILTKPKRYR